MFELDGKKEPAETFIQYFSEYLEWTKDKALF